MPRLTSEEDAAIYAELKPQLAEIRKVVKRVNGELTTLSDIGQVAAVVDITLDFILRYMPDEKKALALSEHLRSQVDIGIKKVYSQHQPPDAKQ
ncbi:hypothetical protein [Chelativorans salis]|uniref:Uncharacterized protein n=1 Tax=Chelativorans salis TaxID=2978478 RepID=A0ABT2LX58_9HYPH|nr:hypothetical protein [Chelativorans sp. EGI FJ00035]MCT7378178.1 hypothetical protein [Chelativorans sp. EGI FJ00035]